MPVQTAYTSEHEPGFEGQRGDFGLMNNFSKACELADGIAFGRAVVRGTVDEQANLPTESGQDLLGFTNHTTAGQADGSDEHLYRQNSPMNIMDIGPVYLFAEQAVVPGDKVFFRHTASGGNTVIGRVRKDADSNTCDEVQNATFEATAGAGDLVLVWLRGNESEIQLSETITALGASVISLLTKISFFDTTLGAQTGTLADGEEGQKKILKMTVDGATDMVVTPANFSDGTTLTFADVNDSCELIFANGSWSLISNNGVVVA